MTLITDLYKKVLNFFNAENKEDDNSKDTACNRLKLVLMQDRAKLEPVIMEKLRKEMIEVISKYIEIDTEALGLNLEAEGETFALMLNIPVIRAKTKEEIEAAENIKLGPQDDDVDEDDEPDEDAETFEDEESNEESVSDNESDDEDEESDEEDDNNESSEDEVFDEPSDNTVNKVQNSEESTKKDVDKGDTPQNQPPQKKKVNQKIKPQSDEGK